MPMMMEQISCAAGDVAQFVQTPVTAAVVHSHFLFRIRFHGKLMATAFPNYGHGVILLNFFFFF